MLEVAREAFATEGLAVSVDTIAARAGVGVGTVYRHFPTKEALFDAIVLDASQALVDEAAQPRALTIRAMPSTGSCG